MGPGGTAPGFGRIDLMALAPVVEARGIGRSFGAMRALDGIDFALSPGVICALLGENGAGKSTLGRILCGHLTPSSGELVFAGQVTRWRSPNEAHRKGAAMVHQHFMLVPSMTIAENLALARGGLGVRGPRGLAADARAMAEEVGFDLGDTGRRIDAIGVGEQQRIEILKALVPLPRLLVLDEPTAALAPREVDVLFEIVRGLAARGVAVILVTHRLTEALALADQVAVLRRGRVVATGPREAFDAARLAAEMVGAAAARTGTPTAAPAIRERPESGGRDALSVRGLRVVDERGVLRVPGLDLDLPAGRVLGIAGVEGNGQDELVQAIAGALPRRRAQGRIEIGGRAITDPALARAAGLGLVPADRLRDALVGPLSLLDNMMLGNSRLAEIAPHGWIDRRRSVEWAKRLLVGRDVRPPEPDLPAAALSGGNQQRLVVARELDRDDLVVLLAAQPTRGLDLMARWKVHARIRELAAGGVAVLLVSSDLEEILDLADDLAVMVRGRLHPVGTTNARREAAGRIMAGMEIGT